MKKIILTLLVLALLIGLIFAWYLMRDTESSPTPAPVDFPIVDPAGGSPAQRSTITVPGQRGSIVVNDFLKDADVHEDPVNPGYHYLGHSSSETDSPYQIVYIPETSYFNVTLLEEPIGEVRRSAEAYLAEKLGIGQEDMCNLIYTVSVPNFVNNFYTGTNLGFSFCPDAVKLP